MFTQNNHIFVNYFILFLFKYIPYKFINIRSATKTSIVFHNIFGLIIPPINTKRIVIILNITIILLLIFFIIKSSANSPKV